MAELPANARVVIIGGGCVGASVLYHLAKAGWSDCVLLEKNELTAGSTWHAAGNIPTFSNSWAIMNMQRYSTELYRRLGEEVDYPMNYHVTGSVRLAHSKERMQEFQRAVDMGNYQGMNLEMMTNEELKDIYPFIETHDLEGGMYDPMDGDMDPAQLTQALAKGARDMGAKVIRFCPAEGVERIRDEWEVTTPKGKIRCEYIVNAAGYYAREIGKMFGREVPMMVMSHQYVLFEDNDKIKEWSTNAGKKLPLLRDVDSSYYLRQEKYGMNLGPYERNCVGHWMTKDDPMPDDFSFQLYPDDLERLEWYLNDAMERVPVLAECGLSKVINGPIPYTPDGLPLIGPMPGVKNAFEACVFTFGICQAGGAGKVLAEWIIEGQTEHDMWAVDPRRFTAFTDQDYCDKKGMEVYGHEYAMHFPYHEWPAARDKKLSPVDAKIRALGGQMGAYNGWERANWFAKEGDDTSEEATHTWSRKGPWQPRIKEECLAVRDGCGVLDLPGFSRFNLEGAGAAEWLRGLITGGLPKIGRMNLAYFATEKGRILTEMSVMRHDEDHFTLITAALAQWHDFEVLQNALPEDSAISITDHTDEFSTFIVTGPKSREILAGMTDADLNSGWLTHQKAKVADQDILLARVSFAGELGWEVHGLRDAMPPIYEALLTAGATPFGMYALNALRIEKTYRAWKGDLSTDYTLLEGGMGRFIKWDKDHFVGKAALEAEHQQGVKKQFVSMIVDAGEYDPPYMSTIWHNGEVVGETTSGAWGYRLDKCIALGVIKSDLATEGTVVQIEIYGEKHDATIQPEGPLWDPKNERIRA